MTFHLIYPDQFPPRRLHHLARLLDSIPCESPHVVIGCISCILYFFLNSISCDLPHVVAGNLLTLRPVEMTGWRETLRYPQNLARNTAKVIIIIIIFIIIIIIVIINLFTIPGQEYCQGHHHHHQSWKVNF